jgi:hypothetical protein
MLPGSPRPSVSRAEVACHAFVPPDCSTSLGYPSTRCAGPFATGRELHVAQDPGTV